MTVQRSRTAMTSANSASSRRRVGDTPFHRSSQIHSAPMVWTRVPRTPPWLEPRSRLKSSLESVAAARMTRWLAHTVYSSSRPASSLASIRPSACGVF